MRHPASGAPAAAIAVALGSLATVLVAPASSQDPSSYAECSYSGATGVLRIQVNDEEGLVRRRGQRIVVRVPTGSSPGYEGVACQGGQATVHNTDRIMLRVLSVGATQGRLSLAGGPLAPGLTPESDGSPEVEVVASVTDEEDELRLEGTAGADHLRGGRVGGVNEVNLNPAAAGDSPDPDLRLKRTGRATLAFRTGPTGDVVVMNGGPEFSEPLDVTGFVGAALGQGADRYAASQSRSYVQAGTGRDSIETGRRGDLVFAGPGADRVTTGPRQDAILLDLGRDRLSSGRGRDIVAALDRRRDRIDCGPGRDRVFADPRDRLKSCERVKHTVRDESG